MAIQNRRGAYNNFDPAKMVPGEWAVVQSDDPNATDGKSVYVAFAAGNIKRVVTSDELASAKTEIESEIDEVETLAQNASDQAENAQTMATQAINTASSAQGAADEASGRANAAQASANDAISRAAVNASEIQNLWSALANVGIDPDDLGLYQDPDTSYVYPTYRDVPSSNGIYIASGGGGGGDNNATLTVTNTTGWLSHTVSANSTCVLTLNWSSVEDDIPTGAGVMTITVGGALRSRQDVAQGNVSIDVSSFLVSGTNKVKVRISDIYDNARTITYTISVVDLAIISSFDPSVFYTAGATIEYTYTPIGAMAKVVHFIVDNESVGVATVTTSGRQQTQILPAMSHGTHSLLVYFTATIDEEVIRSNELYYELIVVDSSSTTPIIASPFRTEEAQQYQTLAIPYTVYTPNALTSNVTLSVNGNQIASLVVDRTQHIWNYRVDEVGDYTLMITSGNASREFELTVGESDIDVEAETNALALYLTSYGRSNNEEHPEIWEDEDRSISATLSGFNFVSDGWIMDSNGFTALRVAGDARVTIPYKPFAQDFRGTGKTIELEFATRNILNYDSAVLSCMSGGRGFQLTAQRALLSSEQSEISTQYKEDEHVRIAFVAEKRSDNRLLYIYINGIMSGVVQYPNDDDFSQTTPVNITIGSNDCTTDVYCIRVYDNNLTRYQILNNWIADSQDITMMLDRYERNNVYDDYGSITIDNLPSDLPYMVITCPELPQYKGDKKTVEGYYTDPVDGTKSFTFTEASADVQGTSSQYYPRKNYKIKFSGGFVMTSTGQTVAKYAMRSNSIPTNTFTFKADVASSEGANNVELVRLYNDTCPYQTPPQEANANVRQGIDGFPMVMFWDDGTTVSFVGKYNFNNDKGTEEVFGFDNGDESWEILNNTSDRVLWKSADYSGSDWLNDFEGRYPDGSENPTNLSALASWLITTDQSAATGNVLPTSYTDVDGNTHTVDNAAYRLAKFKTEAADHFEMDSAIYYYLFTELFLMVDSRAKNAFPSFFGSDKWCWLPYDMDTAIGINNEGSLVFDYSLEDTDTTTGGADVYNGQDSVMWVNLRMAFYDQIKSMYQTLRSQNKLSYAVVENAFEAHQGKWSEAIFNEDAWFKYIDPLVYDGTASYLAMAQGSKAEQRKWWLYNRFRYIDSKYNAGDALTDVIQVRGYAKANITVTPYADIYPTIKYGSYLVSERGHRNVATTLINPLDNVNDTEIYIYSASQLASVGDLSGLKVGFADFSMATKLQSIKVGDNTQGYTNGNLTELYVGNNTLLSSVDARNCTALTGAVDLSGALNVEHVYFDGTAITSCALPNGGILKTLRLPPTITNLTIRNQNSITTFYMPTYENITTLRLENVSDAIDSMEILNAIPTNSRVRLIGLALEAEDAEEIEDFLDYLDTMRGLDENGNNVDTAQVSGTIHTASLTGAQIASFNARYPYLVITADHVTSYLTYKTWDGTTTVRTDTCIDGVPQQASPIVPSRTSTAQYDYTGVGWNLEMDAQVNDPSAITNVLADRTVYAAYGRTVRKYTITWKNADNTTLETDTNVPYGDMPVYNGATPTYQGETATGWTPTVATVTGDQTYTATYIPMYTVTFVRAAADGGGTLWTGRFAEGSTPVYGGATPTTTQGDSTDFTFTGWTPALAPIYANTTYTAVFRDNRAVTIQYLTRNIAEYESSSNTTFEAYGLGYATKLTSAKAPATSVAGYAFANDTALEVVDLSATSGAVTIANSAFSGCTNLQHVIIRSSTMATLSSTGAFTGTPIALGEGAIYVPTSLVATYKANTNWSNYYIADIADYPLSDFSTVSDSWSTIIANANYATDYSVGDIKLVDFGTFGQHYFELVAMDEDTKASGGTARMTWLNKNFLTTHVMNTTATTTGGYDASNMKSWITSDVLPQLQSEIRNALVPVTKISGTYENSAVVVNGQSTTESLWIPSEYEMFGTTTYENTGARYSKFDSNAKRIKYDSNGSASYWWLRSAYSGTNFRYVSYNGYAYYYIAGSANGVVLGFCI